MSHSKTSTMADSQLRDSLVARFSLRNVFYNLEMPTIGRNALIYNTNLLI